MSSGKVVLGVLAGLAAGALLGILLAPDKGSETRKKLKENAGDYADELKKKLNKFVENVTDKFESAKAEAYDLVETGKSKVLGVKKEISSTVDGQITNQF